MHVVGFELSFCMLEILGPQEGFLVEAIEHSGKMDACKRLEELLEEKNFELLFLLLFELTNRKSSFYDQHERLLLDIS